MVRKSISPFFTECPPYWLVIVSGSQVREHIYEIISGI